MQSEDGGEPQVQLAPEQSVEVSSLVQYVGQQIPSVKFQEPHVSPVGIG